MGIVKIMCNSCRCIEWVTIDRTRLHECKRCGIEECAKNRTFVYGEKSEFNLGDDGIMMHTGEKYWERDDTDGVDR